MIPRTKLLGKYSIYEEPKILHNTLKLNSMYPGSCYSAIWVSHIHLDTGILMEHMEMLTEWTAVSEMMDGSGLCHRIWIIQLLRTISTDTGLDALSLTKVVLHGKDSCTAQPSALGTTSKGTGRQKYREEKNTLVFGYIAILLGMFA